MPRPEGRVILLFFRRLKPPAPSVIYELHLSHEKRRKAASASAVQHVNLCYAENGAIMKTNVTLKIDAGLLREARILAAEEDSSISALLAAKLEQAVHERRGYRQARQRAIARLRAGFDLNWTPPGSRDELHER